MPVSVETSFLASASQLPIYLALGRGYYRAAGLGVKITSGKGSAITAQQVGAGHFDIGQTDLGAMALARAKGAPLKSFMAEFNRTTFGVFAARSEGIKTWKELYGKRILVSAGSPETFLLPATFKRLGLNLQRLKVVNVAAANKERDYMSGQADAMGTDLAGAIPRVDAKRPSNHLWFGDVLDVLGYGFVAREDYIAAHPNVIRKFAQATAKALQALATEPNAAKEAVADVVKHTNGVFKPASMSAAWPNYERFYKPAPGHPVGWESATAWKETLTVLHDYAHFRGSMNPQNYFTDALLTSS